MAHHHWGSSGGPCTILPAPPSLSHLLKGCGELGYLCISSQLSLGKG